MGEPPEKPKSQISDLRETAPPAATVQLEFEGVSRLHQGYFSSPTYVRTLVKSLSGCVGLAQLRVTYDTPKRLGRIELVLDSDQLWCGPGRGDENLDLRPLEPLGRALAGYRDAIASAYDFRVASFETGLWIHRGGDTCGLTLAGQYPPDGTSWSPCVEMDPTARRCKPREPQGVDELPASSGASCLGG